MAPLRDLAGEYLSGPLHSYGLATSCRKVNMQVVDIRWREQIFNDATK